MNTKQFHQLGALEGVQEFCTTHPIESPPQGYTARLKALTDVLEKLRAYMLVQGADGEAARGEANRQHVMATRIREEQMIPIRDIAFAWLKNLPELAGKFYVPRSVRGHRPLSMALRVMAENSQPHSDLFIQHGAAPDFVAKLLSSADEVEQAIADRREAARARASATQGIKQVMREGFEVVLQLEAILKPRFGKDKAALASWRAVRRVTKSTGVQKEEAAKTPEAAGPAQSQGVVTGSVSPEVLKAA